LTFGREKFVPMLARMLLRRFSEWGNAWLRGWRKEVSEREHKGDRVGQDVQ